MIDIRIIESPFDPYQEISLHQEKHLIKGQFGACTHFIGTMRDNNNGDKIQSMTLEHYPGMTEKHLQGIAENAQSKWELSDVLIIHRIGRMEPGDPIVLVSVWSAHRKAAFEACRYIMEDLKSKAPFWKQEETSEGKHWVEQNTPG